jgi:DNA gyrase subunit A
VISLSILRHVEATADERAAYLKRAARCGAASKASEEAARREDGDRRHRARRAALCRDVGSRAVHPDHLRARLRQTLSSYEYRITNRGGKGIVAMDIWEGKKGAETIREKTGYLVASFPIRDDDQLVLVTNGGQLIRTKVDGIRIAGRSTQGVIVFDTADDERVVSVERLSEEGEENGG